MARFPARSAVGRQLSRRRRIRHLAAALLMWAITPWAIAAEPSAASPSHADQRPNILILFADDLGYSDLGCYGGEIDTPHLNQLAAQGLRFSQFYNTARCWPSRAALLMGYYAQSVRRDGIPGTQFGSQGQRPPWAPLLPRLLAQAGYQSYVSGKWHVDGLPLQNGFQQAYLLEDHNRHFSPQHQTLNDQPLPPAAKESGYYSSTAIADQAIAMLRSHAQQSPGQPFFHYIAFTSPHFPLQAPAWDIAKYRDRYRDGWNQMQQRRFERVTQLGLCHHALPAMDREAGPPYHIPKNLDQLGPSEVFRALPWDELTPAQRAFQAEKMAIHAAMVDRMDQEIGRILAELRDLHCFENTVILFASDNGASAEIMVRGDGHNAAAPLGSADTFLCLGPGWSSACNTPFRRHKTWVHEGGISTPLIVHWPRGIATRGQVRTAPAHLIDIAPTLLQLAGLTPPAEWDGHRRPAWPGRSLLPVFSDDKPIHADGDLWWFHDGHRALRQGRWKIVRDAKAEAWELYDLDVDRGETQNLAEAHPDRVAEMSRRWEDMLEYHRTLATQE
jgi:arylsulfatase A-like enzyme